MKNILLMLCLAVPAHADETSPQVFTPEIYRRGDEVRIVGEGPRDDLDEIKVDALEPPADDSGMWFVTVWTTPGCTSCEKLKTDFKRTPELNSFVEAQGQMPWAHFNVYNGNDATQKWRKEQYKVISYPTIVVQPPRNKRFGSPEVVVFYQKGYDGNPSKLRDSIKSAVYRYAEKLVSSGGHAQKADVGGPPPFPSPFQQPTTQPFPTYDPNQQYPPPAPSVPYPSQNTAMLFGVLLMIAYAAWDMYRVWARGKGIPLVLDDATKEEIKKLIKDLLVKKDS